MDAKKIKDTRRRLSSEYENLIKSINRSRLAAEEIKLEHTEDEGDLATILWGRTAGSRKVFENVSPQGHAEEVLAAL